MRDRPVMEESNYVPVTMVSLSLLATQLTDEIISFWNAPGEHSCTGKINGPTEVREGK